MTKQEAIDLFGGKNQLIEALGCTRQMIFQWNNQLSPAQADRVIGAYMRVSEERDSRVTTLLRSYTGKPVKEKT